MRVASFFPAHREKYTFRFVSVTMSDSAFKSYVTDRIPRSLAETRSLAAELLNRPDLHGAVRADLENVINGKSRTYGDSMSWIASALVRMNLPREMISEEWWKRFAHRAAWRSKFAPESSGLPKAGHPLAPQAAESAAAKVDAGIAKIVAKTAAYLKTASPAVCSEVSTALLAGSTRATQPNPTTMTAGERAVAEHTATREAAEADRRARYSRNWGEGRRAYLEQLASQYESMPAGAERLDFYSKHHSDLWAAAMQRARRILRKAS